MKDNEDFEWIAQFRSGDSAAFANLVRKYQTRVRGYCANILLDSNAAEDAAQDVFLKVFEHLKDFRADSLFSTWLYRVTVNHCRDILRQLSRKRAESWEQLSEKERDGASIHSSPAQALETIESRDYLGKLLEQLSPDYREVLLLREAHDLSYEQIAEALECSLDAVRARIKRARAQLLECSRHFLEEPIVKIQQGKS